MTHIHHVALHVNDVASEVSWYRRAFECRIGYQDLSWAMLEFDNVCLALVSQGEHPPHVAMMHPQADLFGPLVTHRDGTRSVYVSDPSGNAIEIMDAFDRASSHLTVRGERSPLSRPVPFSRHWRVE